MYYLNKKESFTTYMKIYKMHALIAALIDGRGRDTLAQRAEQYFRGASRVLVNDLVRYRAVEPYHVHDHDRHEGQQHDPGGVVPARETRLARRGTAIIEREHT